MSHSQSQFLKIDAGGLWLCEPLGDPDSPNDYASIRITPEIHAQILAHTEAQGYKLVRAPAKKAASAPAGGDKGFPEFWALHPRKDAKAAALKAWRANKCDQHIDAILADVERRAASEDWQKALGKYVPMATTYLNQRRWEDNSEPVVEERWL